MSHMQSSMNFNKLSPLYNQQQTQEIEYYTYLVKEGKNTISSDLPKPLFFSLEEE